MNRADVVESSGRKGEQSWDVVIEPKKVRLRDEIGSLWFYRDLIYMFVRRDFVSIYKQTILGPLWHVVQPLLMTAVFVAVFGRIISVPTEGIPRFLFFLTGVVLWNFFSTSFTKCSDVFTSNANLFGKIYFPRLAVPVANVITSGITFTVQLAVLCAVLAIYYIKGADIQVTWGVVLLPLVIFYVAMVALGCGLIVSALTTKYRDLAYLVGFGVQLWMYATPIVYPLSEVPEKWQKYSALNPMTMPVEFFRLSFLGKGTIMPEYIGISVIIMMVVFGAGIYLFARSSLDSVDTV